MDSPSQPISSIALASPEVRYVARWVTDSHDNNGLPYVIVDKVNARVFVFDSTGHLEGSTPALLGMTRGDRSPVGIGSKKISAISPADRITPAGRFVASEGRSPHGEWILWIDYPTALALHPVVPGTRLEQRARRLASLTSEDNRISYGCINVSSAFYGTFIAPAFEHSNGIVYILPERSAARDMFTTHDRVEESSTRMAASNRSATATENPRAVSTSPAMSARRGWRE